MNDSETNSERELIFFKKAKQIDVSKINFGTVVNR